MRMIQRWEASVPLRSQKKKAREQSATQKCLKRRWERFEQQWWGFGSKTKEFEHWKSGKVSGSVQRRLKADAMQSNTMELSVSGIWVWFGSLLKEAKRWWGRRKWFMNRVVIVGKLERARLAG